MTTERKLHIALLLIWAVVISWQAWHSAGWLVMVQITVVALLAWRVLMWIRQRA